MAYNLLPATSPIATQVRNPKTVPPASTCTTSRGRFQAYSALSASSPNDAVKTTKLKPMSSAQVSQGTTERVEKGRRGAEGEFGRERAAPADR